VNLKLNILMFVIVVICALGIVASQHKYRQLYVELQEQERLTKQINDEYQQLRAEQQTFTTPARVEKVAIEQLHMQHRSSQVKYVPIEQSLTLPLENRTGNPEKQLEKVSQAPNR
jgi:cell division protein FtsL